MSNPRSQKQTIKLSPPIIIRPAELDTLRWQVIISAMKHGNVSQVLKLWESVPNNGTVANQISIITEAILAGSIPILDALFNKFNLLPEDFMLRAIRDVNNNRKEPQLIRLLLSWLLKNDRFKSVDSTLTALHVRAALGEWDEEINSSKCYDSQGFLPRHYAFFFWDGNKSKTNAQMVDAFDAEETYENTGGKFNLSCALVELNSNFLALICELRPDAIQKLDLNAAHCNQEVFLPVLLLWLNKMELLLQIIKIKTKPTFKLSTKLSSDFSKPAFSEATWRTIGGLLVTKAHGLACAVCIKQSSPCTKCTYLMCQAREILREVAKFEECLRLDETCIITDPSGNATHGISLACVLANSSPDILKRIVESGPKEPGKQENRGALVDLIKPSTLGHSLLFKLVETTQFETVRAILENGNLQNLVLAEKPNSFVILNTLVYYAQWDIVYIYLTRNSRSILVPTLHYAALMKSMSSSNHSGLLELIANDNLNIYAQAPIIVPVDNKKIAALTKKETPDSAPIKKTIPAEKQSPLEELEKKLHSLFTLLTIQYDIKCDAKQAEIMLTAKEDKLRPVVNLIKQILTKNAVSGPIRDGFNPALWVATIKKCSFNVLHNLFTNNDKFTSELVKLAKQEKSDANKQSTGIIQTTIQLRPVPLNDEEEKLWLSTLPSIFCDAREVKIVWSGTYFAVSWDTLTWTMRDRKEANYTEENMTREFIIKQIYSRLQRHLDEKREGIMEIDYETGFCKITPCDKYLSSLATRQEQVYRQLHPREEEVFAIPLSTSDAPKEVPAKSAPKLTLFASNPIVPESKPKLTSIQVLDLLTAICGKLAPRLTIAIIKDRKVIITFNPTACRDFNYQKYFTDLQFVMNALFPNTLAIFDNPHRVVLQYDTKRSADFQTHKQLMQEMYVALCGTAPEEKPEPIAYVRPGPAATPIVAVDTSSTTPASERDLLIRTIRDLNGVKRANFDYHLEQICLIHETSICTTDNDQQILFYAYLIHAMRLFHLIAQVSGKDDTLLYQWRNIIRHALETKTSDEFYGAIHPLMQTLNKIAHLFTHQHLLALYLAKNFLKDNLFTQLIEDISPYKTLLSQKLLGKVDLDGSEISFDADANAKYQTVLANIAKSNLPPHWQIDATLMLRSLTPGEQAIYGAIGHQDFDKPWLEVAAKLSAPAERKRLSP